MKSDLAHYLKMIPVRLVIAFLVLASATAAQPAAAPGQTQQGQPAQAQAGQPQAPKKLDEMVRMRDGVRLATTLYLPDGEGPWPVVLVRTPYDKSFESVRSNPLAWTQRGFVYAVQDVRGKFKSEGQYRPFVDDPQDGYDTVEWAAAQKWSTGKVGMYGASAMGITANLAAMMDPPHLVATFVMVARSSIYNQSAFMGGVFRKELNEIWLKNNNALDALYETFKHNVYDGYYDSNEMSLHWEKARVPSYNWGGWYDIFSEGNVQNFVGLQSKGGGLALGNQKLIMGPWGHGRIEEVTYPANSAVSAGEEAMRWFDYWLKGVDNRIMSEPPVRYYVMGDVTDARAPGNEWRTALAWPPPSKLTSYFLNAGGVLSPRMPEAAEPFQPASAVSDRGSNGAAHSSTYRYDPKNPVPTIGGANLNIKKGPMDQRAIGDRKDVLKFSTASLDRPVEVTGRVTVELWAESDAPDTDWMVKLVDVYPDGTERLVLDSAFRARFREGFNREVFMKKGEVYKFNIDLWNTSIVFNKGHRIAVHVTSSNDPRFDPNPNTGKPLRQDNETRVATNTVHHSRRYPSRVVLPVVPLAVK